MKAATLNAVSIKKVPTKPVAAADFGQACYLKLSILEEDGINGKPNFTLKSITPVPDSPYIARQVKDLTDSDLGNYTLRTYNIHGQELRSYALYSARYVSDVSYTAPSGTIQTYIVRHAGVDAMRVISDGKPSNPIATGTLPNCL